MHPRSKSHNRSRTPGGTFFAPPDSHIRPASFATRPRPNLFLPIDSTVASSRTGVATASEIRVFYLECRDFQKLLCLNDFYIKLHYIIKKVCDRFVHVCNYTAAVFVYSLLLVYTNHP